MIIDLGTSDYSETLKLQRNMADLRNRGQINDIVIFVEHPDVYTEGRHTEKADSIESSIKVERGGSITYHGPGQIISYYIVNLRDRSINILDLIHLIHKATILLLSDYNLVGRSETGRETGVWIKEKKIASTGLAVKEFTTFHGSALNVSTDLEKFNLINPCGFNSQIMTSIENETGKKIEMPKLKRKFESIVEEEFFQ